MLVYVILFALANANILWSGCDISIFKLLKVHIVNEKKNADEGHAQEHLGENHSRCGHVGGGNGVRSILRVMLMTSYGNRMEYNQQQTISFFWWCS